MHTIPVFAAVERVARAGRKGRFRGETAGHEQNTAKDYNTLVVPTLHLPPPSFPSRRRMESSAHYLHSPKWRFRSGSREVGARMPKWSGKYLSNTSACVHLPPQNPRSGTGECGPVIVEEEEEGIQYGCSEGALRIAGGRSAVRDFVRLFCLIKSVRQ